MDRERFIKLIDLQADRYKSLLPVHITAEKFIGAAKTYYTDALAKEKTGKLLSASERSIFLSLEKAAKDGLLMDGNEACFMVFGTEAQYNPMVWGLIKLIQNSGYVSKLSVYVVWSNELFKIKIVNGEEMMEHEPMVFAAEKDKGERIGVYACAKLIDGNTLFKFLSKEKIMKLKAKSQNAKLWDQEADEFWGKSALRQISKFLPKNSAEIKSASEALDSQIIGNDAAEQPVEEEVKTQVPAPVETPKKLPVEPSAPVNLRAEAEAIGKSKGRLGLQAWFKEKSIEEKREIATWLNDVLAPLPKIQEPTKVDSDPNNWEKPEVKKPSSKLAAIVDEEDDYEPEEGDAF